MTIKETEYKQVECLKCGWVGGVIKFIPLKQAWCGHCRSGPLRLVKEESHPSLHDPDIDYDMCDECHTIISDDDPGLCKVCFP